MESYTDPFVTRGLLDKEPKPVELGGWEDEGAVMWRTMCRQAWGAALGNVRFKEIRWEPGHHPLGQATIGAAS